MLCCSRSQQLNRTAPSWGVVLTAGATALDSSGLTQRTSIKTVLVTANKAPFASEAFSGVPLRRLTLSRLLARFLTTAPGLALSATSKSLLQDASTQLAKLVEPVIATPAMPWAFLVMLVPASSFTLGKLPGMPSDAAAITIAEPTLVLSSFDRPQFALRSVVPSAPDRTFAMLRKGLNFFMRLKADGSLEGFRKLNSDTAAAVPVFDAEGSLSSCALCWLLVAARANFARAFLQPRLSSSSRLAACSNSATPCGSLKPL